MEVYVEYVLLENFLYDGGLLWLAYRAAKVEAKGWRLCLAAGVGAVFAVIYPLLRLQALLGGICKIAVGVLLCLLPFEGVRVRGRGRQFFLTVALFFAFSFGFGGALLGVYGPLSLGEKIPSGWIFVGFMGLMIWGLWLIKRLYKKRNVHVGCYACQVYMDGKKQMVQGFYDSGNLATYNGLPVCFISPLLLYDLIGERILEGCGQVCDEMAISTMTGEKKVPIYHGKIGVEDKQFEVYFAPSKNMIGREYAVLIHAKIIEGQADKNAID